MTAAVPRVATAGDHPFLDGYVAHCRLLGVGDRALRDRLRIARRFFEAHPDLGAWMARPLPSRLEDLRRIRAWPLLTHAILSGRVVVDLDLVLAKDLGGFGMAAEVLHREDFGAGREAAARLGWAPGWTNAVLRECLALVIAWTGKKMSELTEDDLSRFRDSVKESAHTPRSSKKTYGSRVFSLHQLLYELGVLDRPPERGPVSSGPEGWLDAVPQPELRQTLLRYLNVRAAVLKPKTIRKLADDLIPFAQWLAEAYPEVTSITQLERRHLEGFLAWNRTRPWRGRKARAQRVAPSSVQRAVLTLRNFLDDITLWGWAERPTRRLLFASDVPSLPQPLPRALPPDQDAALTTAVGELPDLFARCGIRILRGTGLRVGELLDLEVDCVVDYGLAGIWLRVPLGKLGTERSVPLDPDVLGAISAWLAHRGPQRPLPHPETGRPTDFLFCERGRRLKEWRIRRGLAEAAEAAGLRGPDGEPLRITPHQLRHTFATSFVNAGMSLQALMALLGHVTPEMTLRYAKLASPALRAAYEEAAGRVRRRIPVGTPGRPAVPTQVEWMAQEMLKTRVAHGYCSRHLAAGACPYANICEQCDNFAPTPEFVPVLEAQLVDVYELRADAEGRGWESEVERHGRVIASLERHLARLRKTPSP